MKAAIIVFTLFIFFSCKKSYKERKRSTAQGACTAYAAGTVGRTCALRD